MKNEIKLVNSLKNAAIAEVQAISIYEAECFWFQNRERRALLEKILEEEKEHAEALASWVTVSTGIKYFNRIFGWVLGTFLVLLPWKYFCLFQSWAEKEASQIYARTLEEIKGTVNGRESTSLHDLLNRAIESEADHSRRFKRWSEGTAD